MIKTHASVIERGVLLALALAGGAAVVEAGPSPHMKSGLVAMARLQTARLSAVRYPPAARGGVVPVTGACTATLAFHRADGTPYMTRSGQPIQREVALMSDGTATLDLRSSDVFIDNPNIRAQFRASVRMVNPPDPDVPPPTGDFPPGPCRDVVVTLDVFENLTGRTSLFLPHSGFIDDPNILPTGTLP